MTGLKRIGLTFSDKYNDAGQQGPKLDLWIQNIKTVV